MAKYIANYITFDRINKDKDLSSLDDIQRHAIHSDLEFLYCSVNEEERRLELVFTKEEDDG